MFEIIWLQLVACLRWKKSYHWNMPWNWFTMGLVQLCQKSSKFMTLGLWNHFCMAHPFWTEFMILRLCKTFPYMCRPRSECQEHSIAEGFVHTMPELGMTLVGSKGEVHWTFNQYVTNLDSISVWRFNILQVQESNCIVQQDISKLEKIWIQVKYGQTHNDKKWVNVMQSTYNMWRMN